MRVFVAALFLLFSTQAFGFFVSTVCSNANSTFHYSMSMSWDQPRQDHWWWNDQEVRASHRQIGDSVQLEHHEDPMVSSTVYAAKFEVKLPDQTLTDYVICHSSSGF